MAIRPECGYCGCTLSYEVYGASYATIDHVEPRRLGGTDARSNKTLACQGCNHLKGHERWPAPAFTLADLLPVAQTNEQDVYEEDLYGGW